MPYCSRCGVEVNTTVEKCPLCHSPIQKFYEDPAPGREYPVDELSSAPPRLSSLERKITAISMTSFGIMIPLLITLAVDVVINKGITWSIYPSTVMVGCWLMVLPPLIKPYKKHIIIWSEFLIACLFLTSLHFLGHTTVRVITLGMPITFTGAVISDLVVILSCRSARKGSNIASFILMGIGLFCGFTDLFISLALKGVFHMAWSLIVMAAIFPVCGMLLHLHYRKKGWRLISKYFHI